MAVLRFMSQTEMPRMIRKQRMMKALQPVDVWLQQHDTFRTIERCGDDDRIENAKLCLSADLLLVPQDATETAKGLRGFADPGTDLQVRATVFLTLPRYWKLETGSTGGWFGKRWMGTGCAQRLDGRTAMVLVFEQLINRLKAEQWVDKVVSMASRSSQESASKAMSSAYSRSVTRVSSCSFLWLPTSLAL